MLASILKVCNQIVGLKQNRFRPFHNLQVKTQKKPFLLSSVNKVFMSSSTDIVRTLRKDLMVRLHVLHN